VLGNRSPTLRPLQYSTTCRGPPVTLIRQWIRYACLCNSAIVTVCGHSHSLHVLSTSYILAIYLKLYFIHESECAHIHFHACRRRHCTLLHVSLSVLSAAPRASQLIKNDNSSHTDMKTYSTQSTWTMVPSRSNV